MQNKYSWLNKKVLRSVDQIRLWSQNPRLNPEESHVTLVDFAEDLTTEKSDRDAFFNLVTSIVEDGFVPADPVVVWKNIDNDKYYVAEGNRRLVALKLLREPHKAPKNIRSFIRKAASKINITEIEKIYVTVAPTFEEAEWYINQRNSSSSLQRKWSSEQQRRWISSLYEKYEGDIEKLESVTKLEKSDLESIVRLLKIKDFIKLPEVRVHLTDDEFALANSYRFPITILERFFNFTLVKEKWGLEYDGIEVNIISNKASFYYAFAQLIKRIIGDDADKINTRLTKDDLQGVLDSLPVVIFDSTTDSEPENTSSANSEDTNSIDNSSQNQGDVSANNQTVTNQYLKGNVNRNKLILPIYILETDSARLQGLFEELKKLSLTYKNSASAAIRVFLDLAVLNYIETEGLEDAIKAQFHDEIKNIPLKKRLEYIKTHKLSGKPQNIVARLIDPANPYSLDVLNGFIHSTDTHFLNKQFLNGFWDFLFPLFEVLLVINEITD